MYKLIVSLQVYQHSKFPVIAFYFLGGTDFTFDGGTAVRFPNKQLPGNWFEKYTISGWISSEVHNERQYIISWSDGNTPRHDNMGFFVAR